MNPRFRGIFIPTLTTFDDDGEVDFDLLGEMLEFHIAAGVHGLFVLGSTGMGPVMTTEQRVATAEFVMERVRGRLPVIMHAGTADVQTTIRLAQHAQGLGVDGVAVVPPYYFTDHTAWEITAHYKAVARRSTALRCSCTTTSSTPVGPLRRPRPRPCSRKSRPSAA